MSAITTHVLDISSGRPAEAVPIVLEHKRAGAWVEVGRGSTDADGRLRTLLPSGAPLERGLYRITFDTGAYFAATGVDGFYPEASVVFEVRADREHYHVPLLLSPYGYSTYRGS
ncbi:MAG: hydroxyisourate hydrolase [Polyangiaceae bacterium]|jgi:5-hydroxyisourate hydrolase|nr:hydroxyisourate hydrolase [Polyangiaceae bacterium]MBK8936986.1 hydroxyisourate hydrolase [Polyangiaceae bacterium]